MFDFIKKFIQAAPDTQSINIRAESISVNPSSPHFMTTEPYLTFHRQLTMGANKSNDIFTRRNAYLAALSMLPTINKAHLKYEKKPYSVYSLDFLGVIFLMNIGNFSACENALTVMLELRSIEKEFFDKQKEYIAKYRKTAKIVLKFLSENEGILQKKLYDELLDTEYDREIAKHFVRSTLLLRRERVKGTNKLYINYDVLNKSDFGNFLPMDTVS